MALTHTDTNIQNLNINKFDTLADFQAAVNLGQIGMDDISFIDESIQVDWNQSDPTSQDYIKNKPDIPDIPDYTGSDAGMVLKVNASGTGLEWASDDGGDPNVQADWTESDSGEDSFILHMPGVFRDPMNTHDLDGVIIENIVTDIDGNTYNGVILNNQIWMKENLKVSKFADGTTMTNGQGSSSSSTTNPYYYPPDNNTSYISGTGFNYGRLYNFKAIIKNSSSSTSIPSGVQGIAPDGWHVPSWDEFDAMLTYVKSKSKYTLNNTNTYIAKALSSDTLAWTISAVSYSPGLNKQENNKTNFSGAPGGYRISNSYGNVKNEAVYGTCTLNGSSLVRCVSISYNSPTVTERDISQGDAASIRCVMDMPAFEWLATNADRLYLKYTEDGMVWAQLSSVAESGSYSDLLNQPTIPTNTSQLNNNSGFITINDVPAQVNADWNATSGSGMILNKPTIPAAQVNSDWNATSGVAQILNKPDIIPYPNIVNTTCSFATGGTYYSHILTHPVPNNNYNNYDSIQENHFNYNISSSATINTTESNRFEFQFINLSANQGSPFDARAFGISHKLYVKNENSTTLNAKFMDDTTGISQLYYNGIVTSSKSINFDLAQNEFIELEIIYYSGSVVVNNLTLIGGGGGTGSGGGGDTVVGNTITLSTVAQAAISVNNVGSGSVALPNTITSGGTNMPSLATTQTTSIATNDALVFIDADDSSKMKTSTSLKFDTSNTSDFLRKDGTWASASGAPYFYIKDISGYTTLDNSHGVELYINPNPTGTTTGYMYKNVFCYLEIPSNITVNTSSSSRATISYKHYNWAATYIAPGYSYFTHIYNSNSSTAHLKILDEVPTIYSIYANGEKLGDQSNLQNKYFNVDIAPNTYFYLEIQYVYSSHFAHYINLTNETKYVEFFTNNGITTCDTSIDDIITAAKGKKFVYGIKNSILSNTESQDTYILVRYEVSLTDKEVHFRIKGGGKFTNLLIVGTKSYSGGSWGSDVWQSTTVNEYLSDLADVHLHQPSNGQALIYDSSLQQWVNGNVSGGSGSGTEIYKQPNPPSNPTNQMLWLDTDEAFAEVPIPTISDAGKLLGVDSYGNYALLTIINAENIAY